MRELIIIQRDIARVEDKLRILRAEARAYRDAAFADARAAKLNATEAFEHGVLAFYGDGKRVSEVAKHYGISSAKVMRIVRRQDARPALGWNDFLGPVIDLDRLYDDIPYIKGVTEKLARNGIVKFNDLFPLRIRDLFDLENFGRISIEKVIGLFGVKLDWN